MTRRPPRDIPVLRASHVGERANPHQSQAPQYDVEVVKEDEGRVFVRYLLGNTRGWWITEAAWIDWRKLGHP